VRWSPTFAAISIVSSQRQRNGHAGLPIQCLELKSEPTRIHVSDAKESFMAHVYKVVELVGSSSTSIEEAVNTALTRASETLRNLRWFEVLQTRGDIEDGKPAHFQVTLRVGFTLDDT
jgi:flavin-binding protein dodecin